MTQESPPLRLAASLLVFEGKRSKGGFSWLRREKDSMRGWLAAQVSLWQELDVVQHLSGLQLHGS